jgi:hypothetical protein
MEQNNFIEQFKQILETYDNYFEILEDLKNNVFPFHDKDNFITFRRNYYWLKQKSSWEFKKLNNKLIKIVKNKITQSIVSENNN